MQQYRKVITRFFETYMFVIFTMPQYNFKITKIRCKRDAIKNELHLNENYELKNSESHVMIYGIDSL